MASTGTDVIDMDNRQKLRHVMSIDVERGEVVCAHQPLRQKLSRAGDVEVDTYTLRFRSIYPIYAGRFTPYLVHCYGRMQ